jgi:hypothetical protein
MLQDGLGQAFHPAAVGTCHTVQLLQELGEIEAEAQMPAGDLTQRVRLTHSPGMWVGIVERVVGHSGRSVICTDCWTEIGENRGGRQAFRMAGPPA